jgi:hypothetical protein
MSFSNLTINKVIVHELFQRGEDKALRPPRYSEQIINLDREAADALQERITKVLGNQSKSIQMEIAKSGPNSAVDLAESLVRTDAPAVFIEKSCRVADLLADAQKRRDLPGGILVIIQGSVDYPAKRMVAFVKAEPQNGFNSNLEFLKDLFLTPASRMYKIGAFTEVDSGATEQAQRFTAHIYDDLISAASKTDPANYFYDGFLGCQFSQSSAKMTKDFFELTKKFINGLKISGEQKADLATGLYTYLKVDTSPNIEVAAFANTYLSDPQTRDEYTRFMTRTRKFPTTAVRKDLAEMGGLLKQRRVRFRSNIKLIVPAHKFEELVEIETVDAVTVDPKAKGSWTKIMIRDEIANET